MIWVSNGVVSLCTTECRRPIYSRQAVSSRIALRSVRRRSGSTTISIGCTPPSTHKRIESSFHGIASYKIPITRQFLTEVAEKHEVSDVVFRVDNVDDLSGALRRENYSYLVQQRGFRNSVERMCREVERRTSSFSNCFSNVEPATAETWLQAYAV